MYYTYTFTIPFNDFFKVSNGEKITYDMAPFRSKNLPIVWLIGQQNTGKRTHGELMQDNFNFEHINVTQLLRNEAVKDTQRGKTIDDCLKNHKKISDVNSYFLSYPNFHYNFIFSS